ncbi:MAG: septal ring lytic transglycosylase RlpA family protein [Desulfovibrio sp.]|nr:septal ring lytic transglycosylase RlpA family protein [Desulfovibrio sp.]
MAQQKCRAQRRRPRRYAARPLALFLILLLFTLSACATQAPRKKGGTASYTVMGRTYYPLTSADGFTQTGIASYYADDFHGKRTSSGERFNTNSMTCAHTILPFDTKLKVTNLQNGLSVQVRVNDRGPFSKNRIIDLSRSAAEKLEFINQGTARVHIEAIGSEEDLGEKNTVLQPVTEATNSVSFIQVGAFSDKNNAKRSVAAITKLGYRAYMERTARGLYSVRVGPIKDIASAHIALALLKPLFNDAVLLSGAR